jgi:hypothetical protein
MELEVTLIQCLILRHSSRYLRWSIPFHDFEMIGTTMVWSVANDYFENDYLSS